MFIRTSCLKEKWTEEELRTLTEFVLFHTAGSKWPAHKQTKFWRAASDYLKQRLAVNRSSKLQFLVAFLNIVLFFFSS